MLGRVRLPIYSSVCMGFAKRNGFIYMDEMGSSPISSMASSGVSQCPTTSTSHGSNWLTVAQYFSFATRPIAKLNLLGWHSASHGGTRLSTAAMMDHGAPLQSRIARIRHSMSRNLTWCHLTKLQQSHLAFHNNTYQHTTTHEDSFCGTLWHLPSHRGSQCPTMYVITRPPAV